MADREGYDEDGAGTSPSRDDRPSPPTEDEAILQDAKDFYRICRSAEHDQRKREEEDLYFEGVDSWSEGARAARKGGTDATTKKAIPERPALSIPLLDQPIQQVISEVRQARLSIQVKPRAGLATTKMAGYLNGLIRSIQADSGAEGVRVWATDRTIKTGRGYYRIDTEYADDEDPFDLDLRINRILDQSSVYLDVTAQKADWEDGERALDINWVTEEEHQRNWKDANRQPDTSGAFEDQNDLWYQVEANSDRRMYLVATFWRVEHERRPYIHDPRFGAKFLDEFEEEQRESILRGLEEPDTQIRRVDVARRRVMRYLLDGQQILERSLEEGPYIPIIPTIGREYFVDGKHIWKGMVRSTMDVIRAYQVAVSAAVENAGSTARASYIAEEGQIEDHEDVWEQSAMKAFAVLPYKAVAIEGHPVPPPVQQNMEPALQGMLLLARAMKDDIGSLTGLVDPAFRAVNPYDRSGRAIEALQRQGAAGTSSFLDNLATISMMHEGRVLLAKIPHVYDRPGRIVRVMNEEHEDESAIMLKRPFVRDDEGNPIPVPCPQCQGRGTVMMTPPNVDGPWRLAAAMGLLSQPTTCPACQGTGLATKDTMPDRWGPQGRPPQEVEYVDFGEGRYKVTVAIGKSARVAQEEARDAMDSLARAAPQLVPVYADLYVRTLGFPGSGEIADRLQRTNPAANTPEGLKDAPPELLAQLQQLQQQHEAAVAEVQKLQRVIETDQVKANSQKELALLKAHADRHLKALEFQQSLIETAREVRGDERIEALKGRVEAMLAEMEHEFELMKQSIEHRHEVVLERVKQEGKQQEAAAKPTPSPGS